MPAHRAADHPIARPAEGIRPAVAWAGLLVAVPSFWALAYFQHMLLGAAFPFAPAELTAALAVGIDSFGVLAGAYWLRSPRHSELRRWGFVFAILAVLGSTGLMVWSIHRLAPGYELLGLIPALIVFGTTKLFTVWQADRAAARVVEHDHAAELAAAGQRAAAAEAVAAGLADRVAELEARLAAEPAGRRLSVVPPSAEVAAQDDAPIGPVPAVGDGSWSNAAIVADLRGQLDQLDDPEELSRNAVMRTYGIGTARARKLLDEAKVAASAATGT